MKILTGFAIINDRNGKRVTYTFDELDKQGNVISDNNKASFVALNEDMKAIISDLEDLVEVRMNEG